MTNQTQNTKEYNEFTEALAEWYWGACEHLDVSDETYNRMEDPNYCIVLEALVDIEDESEYSTAEKILARNERAIARAIKEKAEHQS